MPELHQTDSTSILREAYQKHRMIVFAALLLLLQACAQPQPREGSIVESIWEPPAGAEAWAIDTAASSLQVRVYPAGALADFGHHHILEFPVTGTVYRMDTLEASAFQLVVPLDDATVDDPAARADAGAPFTKPVSAEAREGTRENMLGPELLRASDHPEIVIESLSIRGEPELLAVTFLAHVGGRIFELTLPARLEQHDDSLNVVIDTEIRQTDLGLEPYSALGGGLQVRDAIDVRARLVAKRNAPR